MTPLMKCGHAANATDAKTGLPCCAICAGLDAGADQVADAVDLTGRRARCAYYGSPIKSRYGGCSGDTCQCEQRSDYAKDHEAFFEHLPDRDYDRFYCGCRGFD